MRGSRIVRLGVSAALLAGLCAMLGAAAAAAAPLNSAAPSIAGSAKDGQHLKATRGTWSGQPPVSYTYHWTRCDASGDNCSDIASATKSFYKASHEDVGHTLRVRVSASDASGEASATSAPTELIAPAALVKRTPPRISGSARDGQLLSVSNGTWRGTPPESFSYAWEACPKSGPCSPIAGAKSSSYRIVSSQIGEKLRVLVTATNAAGAAEARSRPSSKITPGAPVSMASPAISGSLQEGQTLSADPGGWAGTAPIAFAYQWERCSILGGSCQEIAGATASTYTLSVADLASNIAVLVKASNTQGSATASSTETQAVLGILPKNTALPSISGLLQDGSLLSATTGSWSGSEPISYAYQWQLCSGIGKACENITGATGSSLKLEPSEIGKTLALVVTATNAAGSTSATSSLTSLIEGILPKNTALPTIAGTLKLNQLLTATTGSWTGSEPITYAYQWQLCVLGICTNVAKATSSSFLLGALDVGNTLRVIVTATNVVGSTPATSAVTGLIAGLL
jgi:hypothetical protein